MRLGNVFGELHRRSVWQVLGSYAVVAWLILQFAETLEGLIGLPLWFGPAIVVVVLLGFPVLLVTALTQGGRVSSEDQAARFRDAGGGADGSLSSWAPLDRHPIRDALGHVFTWRNAVVGGVLMASLLAIGTAGYSGLRTAGIGSFGSLVAKGVFESNENVILADFEDRTADGTLGETVTALFRIDLSQSTSVHVLDRAEVSQALVRMQHEPTASVTHAVAMEMAEREGVKAVIEGEVLPLGPGAVVSARLVASGSGETLVALRETARTVDAVPDAVDRLSAQLRERIGESLRSIQGDPPLGEVTTGSLEALRKYVQAEWAIDMGDVSTAEGLVKEAISLDPTFSMAHRKLGVILSNAGRNPEEAREAFTLAYQGRERLSDRERLLAEAAYHTYVSEDLDAAVEAYEGVLRDYPTDGIAGNNLAVLYGELDEFEKAADLYVTAIDRGHAPAVSYTNAAFTLFRVGEADSATVILQRFQREYPNHPQATQYAASMAAARFDYPAAEGHVRDLLEAQEGNARWEMWGEAELANYAIIRGRLDAGLEGILRAYDMQDAAGARFVEQPRAVFEVLGTAAVQLHFLDDPEGAVRTLDVALESEPFSDLTPEELAPLDFAGLYAAAGRPDRARERVAAYDRYAAAREGEEPTSAVDAYDNGGAGYQFAAAAIALADGDPQEAIRLYREGRAVLKECVLCGLPELGAAFEAAALPDSAIAVYEEYLQPAALFRSQNDNVSLHRVLLGLGRAYSASGETGRASDYYGWLLDLWNGADPVLQGRVSQIREQVRNLQEGGA